MVSTGYDSGGVSTGTPLTRAARPLLSIPRATFTEFTMNSRPGNSGPGPVWYSPWRSSLFSFVPYGRDHVNPPVGAEPSWDSPETRALARQACFDCHSNETEWPAYSTVAPVSWLIQHDVSEGAAPC